MWTGRVVLVLSSSGLNTYIWCRETCAGPRRGYPIAVVRSLSSTHFSHHVVGVVDLICPLGIHFFFFIK